MRTYRAALVGCSRIGAFIDNEVAHGSSTILPYSHAAGYEACPRTELVAGADLRPDVLEAFGRRYGVSPNHLYTDYQEMILTEHPDILSIATQPEHRAAIALFAIDHGVRALYCEKPLCASMAEAAAIADAVKRHTVIFNMGANRRWHPGYTAMRDTIASGELGPLKTLITSSHPTLFNTASHWFDLLLYLNRDQPVSWVQAFMPDGDHAIAGDEVVADPYCQGTIAFANGVVAHLIDSPQPITHEAICEHGSIVSAANSTSFEIHPWAADARSLSFNPASSTLCLIEDLAHALDTGEPTRGGVDAAYVNTEIIFGFLESHRRNGERVPLPLTQSSLHFAPRDRTPRQPRYER